MQFKLEVAILNTNLVLSGLLFRVDDMMHCWDILHGYVRNKYKLNLAIVHLKHT